MLASPASAGADDDHDNDGILHQHHTFKRGLNVAYITDLYIFKQ
jgi:hypothetical protein